MNVILLDKVGKLGGIGDVVTVKRNLKADIHNWLHSFALLNGAQAQQHSL